ncbi:MAG: hypothetical protein WC666_04555 [Candidatus Paceibacterota bacterium]|jgi:hypothetical protein
MNNQKPPKKTQTYIFIGVLVLLAIIFYFYQSGKGSSSDTLEEVDMSNQMVGANILNLLNQISSLKIDKKLFSEPTYMALKDYTVEITPISVGRANPFAPIPGVPTVKETGSR